MLVVLIVLIVRRSVLAVDDAGVVAQGYLTHSQLETDLVISLVKYNQESAPPAIRNFFPNHDSRSRSSVSRLQTVWLQAFPWPPSDQHKASTGTKAEPVFIRKQNRSPLHPPLSSSLKLLASQMAMARSQWNTRYRAFDSELSLK
ncbi:uncharacterized protein TNCV_3189701 [Trichonephila clavipes]|nr:uncharacterized protein TNCV_3189701 [Trichonephila clavipes]